MSDLSPQSGQSGTLIRSLSRFYEYTPWPDAALGEPTAAELLSRVHSSGFGPTIVGCSAAASLFAWLIALLPGIGGALEVAAINKPATTNAPVSVWGDGRPAYQPQN
jgi:hypothetical protein